MQLKTTDDGASNSSSLRLWKTLFISSYSSERKKEEKTAAEDTLNAYKAAQAINRAGGKAGNKGAESALTAIEMASLFEHHLKA